VRAIGSLFAGIGGLELGLERAGLGRVVWQCEIDPLCREVLARHWPEARRFEDVRATTFPPVDVLCGGFPCQPVSLAGRRRAQADERWLWPAFAQAIKAAAPAIVVAENVPGLRTAGLRDVLADLAALGFDAEWTCIGAFDFGAPHFRRRIVVVATDPRRIVLRDEPGWLGRALESARAPIPRSTALACPASDSACERRGPGGASSHAQRGARPRVGHIAHADAVRRLESSRSLAVERGWARRVGWDIADMAGMDDGIPVRLGAARKAYGNAVCPVWAEEIGKAILSQISPVTP